MNDFPAADQVALAALTSIPTPCKGTATPGPEDANGPLEQNLPFVQVARTGGPTSLYTDYPTLSWSIYAATYADGMSTVSYVKSVLLADPISTNIGQLDVLLALTGPTEINAGSNPIRRWVLTSSHSARRM